MLEDELLGITASLDEQGTSEGTPVLHVQASLWASEQLAELCRFLQCFSECFLIRDSEESQRGMLVLFVQAAPY